MAKFQFIFPSGFTFFSPQRNIYNRVYDEVGDRLAPNGIPLAQEIGGWSELCAVGEEYVTDFFTIKCVE